MALNYNAITALTRKKYVPKLVDNIFESTPLLAYLKRNKEVKAMGHKYVQPLMYANLSGVDSYEYYDTITYDTNIPITAAEYTVKNIVAAFIISKHEERENSGDVRVLELVKSKMDVLEESLKEELATQLYSDGTGNSSKDLDGLEAAIADTGTFGGIDCGTYTWWKSKIYTNNPGSAGTAATLDLDNVWRVALAMSSGKDFPDAIFCGLATWHEMYKAIEEKVTLNTNLGKTMANYGFQTLEFRGIPVIGDTYCTEGEMWFLNKKYLKLIIQKGANFASTKFRPDDTRLAQKSEILVSAALAVSNRRRLAKLEDIDYTALT